MNSVVYNPFERKPFPVETAQFTHLELHVCGDPGTELARLLEDIAVRLQRPSPLSFSMRGEDEQLDITFEWLTFGESWKLWDSKSDLHIDLFPNPGPNKPLAMPKTGGGSLNTNDAITQVVMLRNAAWRLFEGIHRWWVPGNFKGNFEGVSEAEIDPDKVEMWMRAFIGIGIRNLSAPSDYDEFNDVEDDEQVAVIAG